MEKKKKEEGNGMGWNGMGWNKIRWNGMEWVKRWSKKLVYMQWWEWNGRRRLRRR